MTRDPINGDAIALRTVGLLIVALAGGLLAAPASAQDEAQWIWSPADDKYEVPPGDCFFRKTIVLRGTATGKVTIVADDEYELHVNGRRLGTGSDIDKLVEYNISRYLARGRNIVAIKVSNTDGATAALAARVFIQERGDDWRSYSTDDTWKCSTEALPLWNTALYNDRAWDDVQVFGELGQTAPWDVNEEVAGDEPGDAPGMLDEYAESDDANGEIVQDIESHEEHEHSRFRIQEEFRLENVIDGEATGSLISMAFNEFGHIVAGRADGPLLLIYDSDEDDVPDRVKVYCEDVKNCQGILPLNGDVYVTADGPDGPALYRLADRDRDGQLEEVRALVKFNNNGEHGAHGITLGPDGWLYVVVGNHTTVDREPSPDSPYQGAYEGDVVQPRYEDPTGHGKNAKAPGGVVIRTDIDGDSVEVVAGGLRNAYDLAFNRIGDLFVHDSDMESDMGMTWYRPTRLYHVLPGAEFGWRSGWAKWPDYYVDAVPGILDTGRGSPTGAVTYNHFAFPARYHDALFLGDWSEGRILAVTLEPDGATYSASQEVFLEGQPLNVTDLDVGPDGALYFVTGGRSTTGGLYRITWRGEVPEAISDIGTGITAAIRQPQLHSAWGRQTIAKVRKSISNWDRQIAGVANSHSNPWYYRTRALEMMHLYGPTPSTKLLLRLSEDDHEVIRSKAVELMGLHPDDRTNERLAEMLDDDSEVVRRKACEALFRAGLVPSLEQLAPLLSSHDRALAWSARRLLESAESVGWREEVLTTDDQRIFIQGSLALLIAEPGQENAIAILDRFNQLMDGFISDRNFVDMLRVAQVAFCQSGITSEQVPELAARLGDEFPSRHELMNRELMRLLAYLEVSEPLERYLEYLESEESELQKLHIALHLAHIRDGWQEGQRLRVLDYYEQAFGRKGGGSYKGYLGNVARDFAKTLTPLEARAVLSRGNDWPSVALGALYALPGELDDDTRESLADLDSRLIDVEGEAARHLRVGVVAVLARDGQDASLEHLRRIWEDDPERREAAALGMAQHPSDDNWEYMVRSLPVLAGEPAREVLSKLLEIDFAPEEPEPYRQVILRGLELKENGADTAIDVLRWWTGQQLVEDTETWDTVLAAWQDWYAEEYPGRPRAVLPKPNRDSKWSYTELLTYLNHHGASGSVSRGEEVFKRAECIKCHRYGTRGEGLGPDLTSLHKRFMKKEVLEAIVYPSHIISDQYQSKTVVTNEGRVYTGIVGSGGRGQLVVLQANGEQVTIDERDVEDTFPSAKSAMPAGLLDTLTLQDIADLFAYLGMSPPATLAEKPDDTSLE